ncbi:TetR/AcrR family transcriptional regulator [Prauserella sp. PE36]|uniref:TetR/AcrR family transcriptional regulator n=1 Tax=Prauserella sp. PE36 TaxID=1504709 RepID=UPI000D848653|nr:TetR/AcrR family transcriptional regulator [Prauserella sp. PE36]PXY29079.1 TetR family transcriptional regulator [Prauserella coralliicola]RBM14709.1 TetR/AcrR family transcriptional regulator [Prauserella sp. PE36]
MTTRSRLLPAERRRRLLDVGARLFAARPYADVLMEHVAEEAGVSRALLYRYFPNKRDLFAAVYQRAADRLLAQTRLEPGLPLSAQLAAGLDAHFEYFVANRNTVLAANRVLAGDPVIQAVIEGELDVLRGRLLDVTAFEDRDRELVSSALMSWLVFVRALCVEWLTTEAFSRAQLRDMCVGALLGALGAVVDVDRLERPG